MATQRNQENIDREAALDGINVIRTSLPREKSTREEKVIRHKSLAVVERACRSFNSVAQKLRPTGHHKAEGVRAHVFLSTLAYWVEFHMRKPPAPILFDNDGRAAGEPLPDSIVAPAQRSPKARRKAMRKHADDGLPADLATITKNPMQMGERSFEILTAPSSLPLTDLPSSKPARIAPPTPSVASRSQPGEDSGQIEIRPAAWAGLGRERVIRYSATVNQLLNIGPPMTSPRSVWSLPLRVPGTAAVSTSTVTVI